jgi:hypothetical protein
MTPLERRQAMFKDQAATFDAAVSKKSKRDSVHQRREDSAQKARALTFENLVQAAVNAALDVNPQESAELCFSFRHTDTMLFGRLLRRAPRAPELGNFMHRPDVFQVKPCPKPDPRGFAFKVVVACTEGQVFVGTLVVKAFMKGVEFGRLIYETFRPSMGTISPFPGMVGPEGDHYNGFVSVKTVLGSRVGADMTVQRAAKEAGPGVVLYVQLRHGIPLPLDAKFPEVPAPHSRDADSDADSDADADADGMA